jgi:hypothetical protein
MERTMNIDFWQAFETTGYLIEGENRLVAKRQLAGLNASLRSFLAAHPEITQNDKPPEHFAMLAAARLVQALVDSLDTEPWLPPVPQRLVTDGDATPS